MVGENDKKEIFPQKWEVRRRKHFLLPFISKP